MPAYASGKHAYGICDRTGFRYKLEDLVFEVQHGVRTGLRVGKDVLDPDQPQNFLGNVNTSDPQSLLNPRPDVDPGRGLFGWNPVWNPAQYMVISVGRVTVSITEAPNEIVSVTGVSVSSAVDSVAVTGDAGTWDSTGETLDSTAQTYDEG